MNTLSRTKTKKNGISDRSKVHEMKKKTERPHIAQSIRVAFISLLRLPRRINANYSVVGDAAIVERNIFNYTSTFAYKKKKTPK